MIEKILDFIESKEFTYASLGLLLITSIIGVLLHFIK